MPPERLPAPHLPGAIAAQLPAARARIAVGGFGMHVMEQGHGRPVLLVHGNPTWGFLWRKVAAELHDAPLRLVIPDLIGLGLSDKPQDPSLHTIERHGAWLAALLRALDLRGVIVCVQDWGGPFALHALSQEEARCSGIVLLNTAISPPRPGFRPTAFHRFARLPLLSELAFGRMGFPENALQFVQGDRRSLPAELRAAYHFPLRAAGDRVAPLALARLVPDGPSHPSMAPLGRVHEFVTGFRGPVRVVWGMKDPVLGSVVSHVERSLPGATVVRTRAGHFLQEEVPATIAQAIRAVAAEADAREVR